MQHMLLHALSPPLSLSLSRSAISSLNFERGGVGGESIISHETVCYFNESQLKRGRGNRKEAGGGEIWVDSPEH